MSEPKSCRCLAHTTYEKQNVLKHHSNIDNAMYWHRWTGNSSAHRFLRLMILVLDIPKFKVETVTQIN